MATNKISKGASCPLYQRADKLLSHGDLEGARDSLLESVSEDPCNAHSWALLARVYEESDEAEHAAEAARQAVRSDPSNPEWHVLRGTLVLMVEEDAEALAALDEALKLSPDFAPAHFYRAVALARLGKPAPAVASLSRAVELEPGFYELVEDIEELAPLRGEPGFPPPRDAKSAGTNPFREFHLPAEGGSGDA